jgi:hypothetical protein
MVALKGGPTGIYQEACQAKKSEQRIDPPRVAPGCLPEAATLYGNIDRRQLESSR